MKRLVIAFVGLVVLAEGCTLGDSYSDMYGYKCQDWVAIYEEGVRIEPKDSSMEAQDARKAGYCPSNYICSLDSNKNKICRTKCDENSFYAMSNV